MINPQNGYKYSIVFSWFWASKNPIEAVNKFENMAKFIILVLLKNRTNKTASKIKTNSSTTIYKKWLYGIK